MVNPKSLTKNIIIKIGLTLLCPFFIIWPFKLQAYSDTTTHRLITAETAKVFNHYYPQQALSRDEVTRLVQGSVNEDKAPRWLNHFYDPVYGRGLKGLSSSKIWAIDTSAQAGRLVSQNYIGEYFNSPSDFSWDRAIYDYLYGDRLRGLEALGHILHLIQDATVPDHTRDDAHPLWSTYENYTKQFDLGFVPLANNLIAKKQVPINYNNLGAYFDYLANFSNANFFSDDTVLISKYPGPRIKSERGEILSDKLVHYFGYGNHSQVRLVYIKKARDLRDDSVSHSYSLDDPDKKIPQDYWNNLSDKAILAGAGVIKLFFSEVDKERQSKILFEKNKSLVNKFIDKLNVDLWSLLAGVGAFSGHTPPTLVLNPQQNIGPEDVEAKEEDLLPEAQPKVKTEAEKLSELAQILIKLQAQVAELLATREQASAPSLSTQVLDFISGASSSISPSSPELIPVLAFATSTEALVIPTPIITAPSLNPFSLATTSVTISGTASSGLIIFNDFDDQTMLVGDDGLWSFIFSSLPEASSTISFFARTEEGALSLPIPIDLFVALPKPLVVDLSIAECEQSLVSNFCLLTSAEQLNFSWSDLGSYRYQLIKRFYNPKSDNDDGYDQVVVEETTIPNFTLLSSFAPIFMEDFSWQLLVLDPETGVVLASSSPAVTVFHPRPLVINEIAWGGTTASTLDEWIELRNNLFDFKLDLFDLYISDDKGAWRIDLVGQLSPGSFYLIERGDDDVITSYQANLVADWGTAGEKSFDLNQFGLKLYRQASSGDILLDETPLWNRVGAFPSTLERTFEHFPSLQSIAWEDNEGALNRGESLPRARGGVETIGTPSFINFYSIARLR